MGGRNGGQGKCLRIRFKSGGNIRSQLVLSGNPKQARKRFKHGRILKISKVSQEEQFRIGEFSSVVENMEKEIGMKREPNARNPQQDLIKALETL